VWTHEAGNVPVTFSFISNPMILESDLARDVTNIPDWEELWRLVVWR
jgi:hypothetical protein